MSTDVLPEDLLGSAGRLRILRSLAAEGPQEFVQLRGRTGLTDGNLATHTRRLESAGFVAVRKEFRDRKPVTQLRLTPTGRAALEQHARELIDALGMFQSGAGAPAPVHEPQPLLPSDAEDWVD
jgi:DNA-binding MarR family transcriptional regulator